MPLEDADGTLPDDEDDDSGLPPEWTGDRMADALAGALSVSDLIALPTNDWGHAVRLAHRAGRDLLYTSEIGWAVFRDGPAAGGGRWSFDGGHEAALAAAQRVALAIASEELPALLATKPAGKSEDVAVKRFWKRVQAYRRAANSAGNVGKCKSMLEAAAPHLRVRPQDLDADPWRLNVANGTLALDRRGTVTFRPSARDHRCAKQAAAAYIPDAPTAAMDAWMELVLPEPELRHWVQKFLGYCLTGDDAEQVFTVFQGDGANGKSTLLEAVRAALGDYAQTTPVETLLQDERSRAGGQATPDLARLPGARLVTASEPREGAVLDDGLIKRLTGGEPITVRHLNRDFFEFRPTHKTVLVCNPKPQVRAGDGGTWRRIRLVPFRQVLMRDRPVSEFLAALDVPVARSCTALAARVARQPGVTVGDIRDTLMVPDAAAGVLAWLIEGFLAWCGEGLAPAPAAIVQETDEYKRESDPIPLFVDEVFVRAPGAEVRAKHLRILLEIWSSESVGVPRKISDKRLSASLKRLGIADRKSNGAIYIGLFAKTHWKEQLDRALEAAERRGGGFDFGRG